MQIRDRLARTVPRRVAPFISLPARPRSPEFRSGNNHRPVGIIENVAIQVENCSPDLLLVLHAPRVLRQNGVPDVRQDQATRHADIEIGRFRVDGL